MNYFKSLLVDTFTFSEHVSRKQVLLSSWLTAFILLVVGIEAFFKYTHVGMHHTSWEDLVLPLIGIPFFWFGLFMCWWPKTASTKV